MSNNRIENLIKDTYTEYLSSGYMASNFYDLTLSILGWKALSDYHIKNVPEHFPKSSFPGKKYCFDEVMKDNSNSGHKYTVEHALIMWDEVKALPLKGLLQIQRDDLKEIHDETWEKICRRWATFFKISEQQEMDVIPQIIAIMDHLELSISQKEPVGAFYTPKEITEMMVHFLDNGNRKNLYDPHCGSGSFLYTAAQKIKKLNTIHGSSPTKLSWKYTNLRLILLKLSGDINPFAEIKIDKGNYYQVDQTDIKFDTIITNPPFGKRPQDQKFSVIGEWTELVAKSNRMELLFLGHVLDRMKKNGRAAIIIPAIFLSGLDLIKKLRTNIIHANILDAIITLPPGIFPKTGVKTVILFFAMNRENENVYMLDATKIGYKTGKHLYLDELKIKEFIQQFKQQKYIKSENILLATTKEIKDNDFDLRFSSYQDEAISSIPKTSSSSALLAECEHLEKELALARQRLSLLMINEQRIVQ